MTLPFNLRPDSADNYSERLTTLDFGDWIDGRRNSMQQDYLGVADTYIKSARRRRTTFILSSLVIACAIAAVTGFSYWQVEESNRRFAAMQHQLESQLDSLRVFQGQIGYFYSQLEAATLRLDSAQWRLEKISSSDLQSLNMVVTNQQAMLSSLRDSLTQTRSRLFQSSERIGSLGMRFDSTAERTSELTSQLSSLANSVDRIAQSSEQLTRLQTRFDEQLVGSRQMRETIVSLSQRITELEKKQAPLAIDSIR